MSTSSSEDEYLELESSEFIKILKGEYSSDSNYNKFYLVDESGEVSWVVIEKVWVHEKIEIVESDVFELSIEISNCYFENGFNLWEGVFHGYFRLYNLECLDNFEINGKFHNGLYISNCRYYGTFDISRGDISKLTISGGKFYDLFQLGKSCDFQIDHLEIIGGTFKSGFKISNGTYDFFEIRGGLFKGRCRIFGNHICIKSLHLRGGVFESPFDITDGKFGKFYLSGGTYQNGINVIGKEISIRDFSYTAAGFSNALLIHEAKLVDLNLRLNTSISSRIEIFNVTIRNLILDKFTNTGDFTLINIKFSSQSTLMILNSRLGGMNFHNVRFSELSNIFIDGTNFEKSLFYNSDFPIEENAIKAIRINSIVQTLNFHDRVHQNHMFSPEFSPKLKNGKEKYYSLYETYSSLLAVAIKQNNIKNKRRYYKASQNNLLMAELNEDKLKNIPSISSLLTSKFYSDFGQNWFRALIVTLFIGIVFFSILLVTLPKVRLTIYDINWVLTLELWSYYFEFLNPIHKSDFLENVSTLGNSSRFIDFVGRIFIGIGIYEIIRSFRKYSVK